LQLARTSHAETCNLQDDLTGRKLSKRTNKAGTISLSSIFKCLRWMASNYSATCVGLDLKYRSWT